MKEKQASKNRNTIIARWVAFTLVAAIAASTAGCSGTTTPAESTGPAPTAVTMTSEPTGWAQTTAQAHEPDDDFETISPVLTPWPEPKSVDYAGQWLAVAQDKEPAKYPAFTLAGEPIVTTWGALRLPEGWAVRDADSFLPTIVDNTGRAVGIIEQIESYPDEPWFSLLPDGATAILWETPDYPLDARVLTMESDTTAAEDAHRNTIRRQVTLIVGGPVIDDGGTACYQAISLIFDKAYLDGGKVEYVLSNKVIDEIAKSFVESWSNN